MNQRTLPSTWWATNICTAARRRIDARINEIRKFTALTFPSNQFSGLRASSEELTRRIVDCGNRSSRCRWRTGRPWSQSFCGNHNAMSRGSRSKFGESIPALRGSLRCWKLDGIYIFICYKMLVSCHVIHSLGYSLLPVFIVLKCVLILVGDRATRPPAPLRFVEAVVIAGACTGSSRSIDSTSLMFARVCRCANGFSLSSLNIVIVAWRLARRVAEFGPGILY